jgi:hypothetical protein
MATHTTLLAAADIQDGSIYLSTMDQTYLTTSRSVEVKMLKPGQLK